MANMTSLAHPYANAVFELAKASNSIDTWLDNLSTLNQIAQDSNFNSLITNPKLSKEALIEVFVSVVPSKNDEVVNLLNQLQANGRLQMLPEIYILFEQLVRQDRNTATATIQTAFAMSEKDKCEIEQLLSKRFAKTVTSTVEINPQLIGGIKIFMDDTVIDSSVKGSLEKMATELIQ
jgi:F-type H+-transporting ATPase subunit delta